MLSGSRDFQRKMTRDQNRQEGNRKRRIGGQRGFCDRVLLGELDVERAAAVINIATLRPIIPYHADRCQRCVEDSNYTDRCRNILGISILNLPTLHTGR